MLQKTFRVTRDATDEDLANSVDFEKVIRYLYEGRLRDPIKKYICENKHILAKRIQKSFCKVDGKFVRNCSCKVSIILDIILFDKHFTVAGQGQGY